MLHKIEDKKEKNMDDQRNPREAQKSMEASDILKIVEDAFYNRFFIVDIIVRDDERTMQAVLKHPSIGVQGLFMKTPKGKLD